MSVEYVYKVDESNRVSPLFSLRLVVTDERASVIQIHADSGSPKNNTWNHFLPKLLFLSLPLSLPLP